MMDVRCPFCGNTVYMDARVEYIDKIVTECECHYCDVEFKHTQWFSFTEHVRMPNNKSFEEVFGVKHEN